MSRFKKINKSEVDNVEFLIQQNEALYEAKEIDKFKFIENSLRLASHLESMLHSETSSVKIDLSPVRLELHIAQLKRCNRN
ncbi:MAG: hypothetical protein EOO44_15215 [Flavobacterium sp.]|nr:MAG: hypothetical protein EOO44_15215 [Flavobacterium sp.]